MTEALMRRQIVREAPRPLPTAAPLTDRKLTMAQVTGIERLNDDCKRLLVRLFDSPMTLREASGFFEGQTKIKDCLRQINKWAREEFGENVTITESLGGKKNSTGFWILKLNQNVADVDYSTYDVKKHVKIQDILTTECRILVAEIARRGWITEKELNALGFERLNYLNKQAIQKGFPPPLMKTRTLPKITLVNPEFAKMFGIVIAKRVGLDEMFSDFDLRVINYIINHGESRSTELTREFKTSEQQLIIAKKRINERCKELGIPDAIVRKGTYNFSVLDLAPEFMKVFNIRKNTHEQLSSFFTSTVIRTIEEIRKDPFIRSRDIAKKLGLTGHATDIHIKEIKRICKERKLPQPFIQIGKARSLYALSDDFYKRFDLEKVNVDAMKCIPGKKQRKIYEFFKKNPNKTIVEASGELFISKENLVKQVNIINKYLTAAGFQTIIVAPSTKKPKYRRFEDLAETIIRARIELGYWPVNKGELAKIDENGRRAITRYGGMDKVMKKLLENIINDRITDIRLSDFHVIENLDYSKYGSDADLIRKTFLDALKKGVERSQILEIYGSNINTGALILRTDRLRPKFRFKIKSKK